jgi:hypothetical protein
MAEIWGKSMDLGISNKNQSRNEILKKSLFGHVDFFLNLGENWVGWIWPF